MINWTIICNRLSNNYKDQDGIMILIISTITTMFMMIIMIMMIDIHVIGNRRRSHALKPEKRETIQIKDINHCFIGKLLCAGGEGRL